MASAKQRRKQRRLQGQSVTTAVVAEPAVDALPPATADRWLHLEHQRDVVIVVGQHRACAEHLRRLADSASARGLRVEHRAGVLDIDDVRYVTANDPHRFMGLGNVVDVIVLHGAEPAAVRAAQQRRARLLPHQVYILDEARQRDHMREIVAGYRGKWPTPQPDRTPPVSVDVRALWKLGAGERAEALRALGSVLRPFVPAVADELETYDGRTAEPAPDDLDPAPATTTINITYGAPHTVDLDRLRAEVDRRALVRRIGTVGGVPVFSEPALDVGQSYLVRRGPDDEDDEVVAVMGVGPERG